MFDQSQLPIDAAEVLAAIREPLSEKEKREIERSVDIVNGMSMVMEIYSPYVGGYDVDMLHDEIRWAVTEIKKLIAKGEKNDIKSEK